MKIATHDLIPKSIRTHDNLGIHCLQIASGQGHLWFLVLVKSQLFEPVRLSLSDVREL